MAHAAVRPLLRRWPRWHQHCSSRATSNLFLSSSPSLLTAKNPKVAFRHLHSTSFLSCRRSVYRFRGLESAEVLDPSQSSESYGGDAESGFQAEKSRNEKKREAQEIFYLGMKLATLPDSTIRTILRAVSVDRQEQVFDALILAKKLTQVERSSVREGRRRQFNYIGRMLMDVDSDLLHDLILATKLGDVAKFQELSASSGALIVEDCYEEEEEEEPCDYILTATRWFKGLITKDNDITKEVYSVTSVEFDRRELRKLIREVQSIQRQFDAEENKIQVEASLIRAKRSLTRFLQVIAKQMPTE